MQRVLLFIYFGEGKNKFSNRIGFSIINLVTALDRRNCYRSQRASVVHHADEADEQFDIVAYCHVVREQDVHAPGLSEHRSSLDETGSVFQQAEADQQQGQHKQLGAGTVPSDHGVIRVRRYDIES